ncbi:hypothetical protein OPS25_13855 [Alteromonas ponticola]|uniref:Uncharacterized protein n=1 Tax=Alteromonas aquimaris TaxID=2998417 RepID=A0ABT3P9Z4_9ALTE|nr:hypothetical protein [Alteromonas aquimaris]MCW8109589.1 hypothetical protein [Alteromonas aquimaris]
MKYLFAATISMFVIYGQSARAEDCAKSPYTPAAGQVMVSAFAKTEAESVELARMNLSAQIADSHVTAQYISTQTNDALQLYDSAAIAYQKTLVKQRLSIHSTVCRGGVKTWAIYDTRSASSKIANYLAATKQRLSIPHYLGGLASIALPAHYAQSSPVLSANADALLVQINHEQFVLSETDVAEIVTPPELNGLGITARHTAKPFILKQLTTLHSTDIDAFYCTDTGRCFLLYSGAINADKPLEVAKARFDQPTRGHIVMVTRDTLADASTNTPYQLYIALLRQSESIPEQISWLPINS